MFLYDLLYMPQIYRSIQSFSLLRLKQQLAYILTCLTTRAQPLTQWPSLTVNAMTAVYCTWQYIAYIMAAFMYFDPTFSLALEFG